MARECLDDHLGSCTGRIEYRYPLSPSGHSRPRCDHHWDMRLEAQAKIDRRYPPHPPADFDPSYAGENWDEEY